MKSLIHKTSQYFYNSSIGIFIIRLVTGFIFIIEGWSKFQNLSGISHFMVHLGLPMWMGLFIATLELVGGIALILGFFTRIFGVVFGIEMLFVVFLTGWARGIGSHDIELLLAATSFGIAFIGSGKYALLPMECKKCGGMFCKTCEDKNRI
jgi:uncharacterized membrane protein YphA (DoxX/SURF4 family)